MRVPRVRFTVRRLMGVVAIVAVCLASRIWVEELRQRRKVFSEWAAYHEFAELNAEQRLECYAWVMVMRIHRLEDQITARRVEIEEERQRSVWTPAKFENAQEELERLRARVGYIRSDTKAYLADHMGVWRKERDDHAKLKRKFEHAAARPWTISSRPAHPPESGFRCGTGQKEMDREIEKLRSEGVSISEVLPDTDISSARPGDGPKSNPES